MCTPIVIDSPQVDLSKDPLNQTAAPVGTGTTAPGPTTATTTPASDGTPAPELNTAGTGDGTPVPAKTGTPTGENQGGTAGPGGSNGPPVNVGTDGTAANTPLDQNMLLINSLTDLAHHFTDTTSDILKGQTDATNALKQGFLDLTKSQQDALKAADELRKNSGQASRKPNYSLSLSANRRTNSRGASSTMLTGSAGVPANSLALGRAQLLGGEAA